MRNFLFIIFFVSVLTACGGNRISQPSPPAPPAAKTQEPSTKPSATDTQSTSDNTDGSTKPGGYYLDDGPEENPPQNLDDIPDATPKYEPINPIANKPYKALGEVYVPITNAQSFTQSGVASWYGKRFHGKKTSTGETYDMYAMTAAHPTLPLPSYVKVTNPANQRSVIVRINDRGPFKHDRIIDLSYAAAYKLRMINQGSAHVQIESVDVASYKTQSQTLAADKKQQTASNPLTLKENSTQGSAISQFFVQVGAFKLEENATKLKQKILNLGITGTSNINHVYNNDLHRLKLGPYSSRSKADQIAAEIRRQLNISSLISQ
ncbi:MAG: septal ring lytic transglycosylase RlpA family protein [Methylophilus sp.]|nr:septal ring lytic transglycosylase RlpA family protein [Methylophilus sp.]